MDKIRIEKEGAVTTILLQRPEVRNAIDRETAEALVSAFEGFEADEEASVAVLYGEGGTFCAGADLKAISQGQGNRLEAEGAGPLGPTRMRLKKPVIAAIAGYAVAGGLELAIWCDLRVAEEDALFGCFERRWGVPLIDGGTIRLPRLIGLGRALDLILTGRSVGAKEAQQIGLVDRLVPVGQARQAAEALAQEISRFPQACLRGDRRSVYDQYDLAWEDALKREFEYGKEALKKETLAGAKAFAQGAGRHGKTDLDQAEARGTTQGHNVDRSEVGKAEGGRTLVSSEERKMDGNAKGSEEGKRT